MSFLEPLFLIGLLAASLPILVHLFNRKKAVKRPFPAMKLLLASQESSARSIKIRQRALLLLRVLLIALLALALAKPFFLSSQGLTANERLPTAVVLVVDTSASLKHGEWWSRAKEHAQESLGRLRPWDEVALVTTDGLKSSRLQTDHDTVEDQLGKLSPGSTSGDLSSSLEIAAELLQTSQLPNRRIILISDFAKDALPPGATPPGLAGIDVTLHSVRADKEQHPRNLAIAGLEYNQSGENQNQWVIDVTLKNAGPSLEKGVELRLEIEGKLLSSQSVPEIKSGEEKRVQFSYEGDPSTTQPMRGRVFLEASKNQDAFSQDDQWHFVFRPRNRIEVLVVNGEASALKDEDETFFLGAALNPRRDTRRGIVTTTITPEAMAEKEFGDYDAVILANVSRVIAPVASKLENFVNDGGGLLITGGDQIKFDAYNQTLANLLPRPLRGLKKLTERSDPDAPVKLTRFGTSAHLHPIFRAFLASGGESLQTTQIYSYLLFEPQAQSSTKTLLTLQDNAPVLLERSVGRGRVLFYASSIDFEWSDFPVRTSFLPLMQRMVRYLARRVSSKGAQLPTVGKPLELDVTNMVQERLILTFGEDQRAVIKFDPPKDDEPQDQTVASYTPSKPGVYQVWADDVTPKKTTNRLAMLDFAANLSRDESNLKGQPTAQWQQWIETGDQEPQGAGDRSKQTAVQNTKRVNIWPKLLFFVTLLLLLETVLGTRRSVLRKVFRRAGS